MLHGSSSRTRVFIGLALDRTVRGAPSATFSLGERLETDRPRKGKNFSRSEFQSGRSSGGRKTEGGEGPDSNPSTGWLSPPSEPSSGGFSLSVD